MFSIPSLPLAALLLIFVLAAAAVWGAVFHLPHVTDVLSKRWGMGEALGGMVLLAIVTNLPELAITISGALRQDLGLAVGNILGGISVQTVVLIVYIIGIPGLFAMVRS